jgi:hypothetical protein
MTLGKLCLAACLGAIPAVAAAQSVSVDVGVNVGADSYDSEAPGAPVESVDVFYDQLEPYGTWVDEPDVGRVYIPDTPDYVPYRTGHWQYTNLGFVWISTEPHAWATSHYGRWAFSSHYNRWYWLPDTTWGPAWVEWRQTGTHYGWAPLAPEVVLRAGWQPPVESWHYCGAEHVLDPNVVRFYEPRERVVVIHREARPMEHYATVSRARVIVGPPAASLREHRIAVHPVRCEARTVGRWTPAEAHAQVEHAHDHRAAFEAQNQHRIDSNVRIHAAHVKVIETHPQIKAEVNARVEIAHRPAEEHGRPGEHAITPHETKPPEHAPPPAQPPHVQPPPHAQPPHEAQPPQAQPPHEQAPPPHAQPPHEAQPPHAQPPHEQAPPRPNREPPTREHNAPSEQAPHAQPQQPPAARPAEHAQPPRAEHKEEHKEEHKDERKEEHH